MSAAHWRPKLWPVHTLEHAIAMIEDFTGEELVQKNSKNFDSCTATKTTNQARHIDALSNRIMLGLHRRRYLSRATRT